jgi:16S rRNA (cytosine1402-N4)-methyltransferase
LWFFFFFKAEAALRVRHWGLELRGGSSQPLDKPNFGKVDGVLLDLGVSSYQLDNSDRGFSYRFDSRLDMRMNRDQGLSAYEVINNYSEEKLVKILYDYGEEKFAKRIVANIIAERQKAPIETTGQLVKLIENAYPKKLLYSGGSVAKQTFQAIRIEVNGELDRLKEVLYDIVDRLNKDGRLCVITFHSLEDRIVKLAFKDMATECICPPSAIICVCNHKASVKILSKKPVTASEEELKNNKRSQSAKLRVVSKL